MSWWNYYKINKTIISSYNIMLIKRYINNTYWLDLLWIDNYPVIFLYFAHLSNELLLVKSMVHNGYDLDISASVVHKIDVYKQVFISIWYLPLDPNRQSQILPIWINNDQLSFQSIALTYESRTVKLRFWVTRWFLYIYLYKIFIVLKWKQWQQ